MVTMSGKERILTAMRHGIPDRGPSTPDISIMIPARVLGVNFYDDYDLTHAYINTANYFGIDSWMFNGSLQIKTDSKVWYEKKMVRDTYEVKEYLTIAHTPDGDMVQRAVAMRGVLETVTEKYVKDIRADFKKLKHLYPTITGYDRTMYDEQLVRMGDRGMICCFVDCPDFQNFVGWMDIERLTYAYYDEPELFEELTEINHKRSIRLMEMSADAKVETILTGGSGAITLQSPSIFEKLSLPTIKAVTKIAKQACIVSGIHSCGKEYDLIRLCAEQTDLDYVNPIENLPQSDCELADIKQKFGDKLALMGNLHTSRTMLGPVDKGFGLVLGAAPHIPTRTRRRRCWALGVFLHHLQLRISRMRDGAAQLLYFTGGFVRDPQRA